MAWYRAGTVSVTNNSTAVIGAATAWVTAAAVGETFLGPDGQSYEIVAINSATSLTIAPAYKGGTASGQNYAIMPTQGYLRDLAAAAAALVESYSTVKNNAGAGKFAAGTSANPSLRNVADENTGLNFLGNDILALITAGAERLRIAANGTPSGTAADYMMNRANHTGAQAISTVSGLQDALNSKANLSSPALTGAPSAPSLRLGNVLSSNVNTLDYYEEGTFTPTFSGGSTTGEAGYNTALGRFTRIGNRVDYSLYLVISSKGGAAGQIRLGGLPFTVNGSPASRGGVSIGFIGGMAMSTNAPVSAFHGHGTSQIWFYKQSEVGAASNLFVDEVTDTFTAYISGTYEV